MEKRQRRDRDRLIEDLYLGMRTRPSCVRTIETLWRDRDGLIVGLYLPKECARDRLACERSTRSTGTDGLSLEGIGWAGKRSTAMRVWSIADRCPIGRSSRSRHRDHHDRGYARIVGTRDRADGRLVASGRTNKSCERQPCDRTPQPARRAAGRAQTSRRFPVSVWSRREGLRDQGLRFRDQHCGARATASLRPT